MKKPARRSALERRGQPRRAAGNFHTHRVGANTGRRGRGRGAEWRSGTYRLPPAGHIRGMPIRNSGLRRRS
jgi:hypothetical protein